MHDFPLPTKELQCYSYIYGRRSFSKREKVTYQTLHKGYTGEKKFAQLIRKKLTNNHLALYGLLFEDRGNLYQIDCLLIFSNQILPIEIKYFQGEYEFKDDSLLDCLHQKEYRNPLHQLKRSTIYLHDLLQKLRTKLPMQPHLVFNHEQFTLFHAKRKTPIILPTQIHSFLNQLQQIQGVIQQHHYHLADQLKQLHLPTSPYERLPKYEYNSLRKGVLCHHCRDKMKVHHRKLKCISCAYTELLDSGILRNTIEFHVLFPDEKIKTGMIEEWCGGIVSRKTINRILTSYFKRHSYISGSYYTFY